MEALQNVATPEYPERCVQNAKKDDLHVIHQLNHIFFGQLVLHCVFAGLGRGGVAELASERRSLEKWTYHPSASEKFCRSSISFLESFVSWMQMMSVCVHIRVYTWNCSTSKTTSTACLG